MKRQTWVPYFAILICGFLILTFCLALLQLSGSFYYTHEFRPGRPIRWVVWLCWSASAVALVALFFGLQIPKNWPGLWPTLVLFAISFRVVLVFSNPILEVDYYRYLWDGIAANSEVSPYRFSPATILGPPQSDPELQRLQSLVDQKPTLNEIVARVHFEQYTTLYPPVSQSVFRLTTALIPDQSSVDFHVSAIKSSLVLFDLGVIVCLLWLLSLMNRHPAWVVAYGWNPLVLKEIANGGHLDSIAIFFMTAGLAAFFYYAKSLNHDDTDPTSASRNETMSNSASIWALSLSAVLFSLGIGAKLFPVILLPGMSFYLVLKKKWLPAVLFLVLCLGTTIFILSPMLTTERYQPPSQNEVSGGPPEATNDGFTVFMTNWRMNDAIFSFIYQNIEYDWNDQGPAWYVLVPNEIRTQWCQSLSEIKMASSNGPYFVARLVTVALFGNFYLWMLFRLKKISFDDLPNWFFLILAIFFYLQPTQNPWYWLWSMPLVCFATNRGWLFVSGILPVYYLRFWYSEMGQTHTFLGGQYVGYDYFDHVIVWLEFLLVVILLAGWPKIERFIQIRNWDRIFESESECPPEDMREASISNRI